MNKISKSESGFGIVPVIVVLVVLCLVALTGVLVYKNQSKTDSVVDSNAVVGKIYKKSSFGDGGFLYNCSKKIEVKYQGSSLGPGAVYTPVNQEEFSKYCRSDAAIEYRAVIDILKREDINRLVAKYDTTKISVRALGHSYIHDKEYLRRILPAYSNVIIDCIIVVHSPEGTRFFIENGDTHTSHNDHKYIEVPSTEFLASLNKASDADVTNFWLALH